MNNDDSPKQGQHSDDEAIASSDLDQSKELIEDADTETSRRRVCQALGVLATTALAGCGSLNDDTIPGGGATTNGSGGASATMTTVSSAADMGDLITAHVAQIEGQSYTVTAELQGTGSNPTIKKEIEYKRSTSGRPFVSLTEVSTIEDGVESLTHYFASDFQGIEIGFEDGTKNAGSLDVPRDILVITGESIFQEFLTGAAVAEPDEVTGDSGEIHEEYSIKAHQGFDFKSGVVVVGPNDLIRRFRLEWIDSENVERWVDAEIYDVGSTEIDRPGF